MTQFDTVATCIITPQAEAEVTRLQAALANLPELWTFTEILTTR